MSVKRNEFIQHLATNHCFLHRHGSKHDIHQNNLTKKKTTVPNPKDSNVYSKSNTSEYTTPKGSHNFLHHFFYKHEIPLGLITIQNVWPGKKYNSVINEIKTSNPKDSNVYRMKTD
jgi:hypothetical protein